jgi:hypothetical protein
MAGTLCLSTVEIVRRWRDPAAGRRVSIDEFATLDLVRLR